MKIVLWRGYHSEELKDLLTQAWEQKSLLILCPPLLNDISFTKHLPPGEIILEGDWGLNPPAPVSFHQGVAYPETPILGVFTSGTTSGEPRLILYSKKNILSSFAGILSYVDPQKVTSIYCYPQPFHTFGLLLGYVLSLYLKIPLHMLIGKYTQKTHEKWLEINEPGLLTLGTPTHFFDLLDFVKKNNAQPKTSHTCIIGGAPVSVELWEKIQEKLNIQKPTIGYGCTEASPGITHMPAGQKPIQDGEIGYPLKGLKSEVLANQGVHIEGDSLCLAIVEKDFLHFPKSQIIRDGIQVREDGVWIYQGRLDYILNRGGAKFSLEYIEQVILKELGFHIVCVTEPDERLGEDLGILLRLERNSLLKDKIKDNFTKLNEVLEKYFAFKLNPKNYKEVESFPLNESMKVDRQKVQALLRNSNQAIDAKELLKWIPHRSPMVWVDEVTKTSPGGGECLVRLKEGAYYLDESNKLRPTSLIEFVAQAHAFSAVAYAVEQEGELKPFKETFLVSITDFSYEDFEKYPEIYSDRKLFIRIGPSRMIGAINIFSGSIWTNKNNCIGKVNLKVFTSF